eukprot:m.339756 g.339756  ORF g.339756 m.339756 type:complete len:99 (+) comp16096_c0_seq18:773-1069(+)
MTTTEATDELFTAMTAAQRSDVPYALRMRLATQFLMRYRELINVRRHRLLKHFNFKLDDDEVEQVQALLPLWCMHITRNRTRSSDGEPVPPVLLVLPS